MGNKVCNSWYLNDLSSSAPAKSVDDDMSIPFGCYIFFLSLNIRNYFQKSSGRHEHGLAPKFLYGTRCVDFQRNGEMISNAGVKDIEFNKVRCGSCGHSWLRREGIKSETCPACGSAYMEDEHRNVDRKN